MAIHTTDDESRRAPDRATPKGGADGLAAEVVDDGDGPAECTLYSTGVDDMTLMTQWITARGDAFVNLDSMR
jgi:hypothetical protein